MPKSKYHTITSSQEISNQQTFENIKAFYFAGLPSCKQINSKKKENNIKNWTPKQEFSNLHPMHILSCLENTFRWTITNTIVVPWSIFSPPAQIFVPGNCLPSNNHLLSLWLPWQFLPTSQQYQQKLFLYCKSLLLPLGDLQHIDCLWAPIPVAPRFVPCG